MRSNELWKLLPTAFGGEDLSGLNRVDEKMTFMKRHHIDFVDVIEEVEVRSGSEDDVKDSFIDKHVAKWRDVISELQALLSMPCASPVVHSPTFPESIHGSSKSKITAGSTTFNSGGL
jgi:hypothetical protein